MQFGIVDADGGLSLWQTNTSGNAPKPYLVRLTHSVTYIFLHGLSLEGANTHIYYSKLQLQLKITEIQSHWQSDHIHMWTCRWIVFWSQCILQPCFYIHFQLSRYRLNVNKRWKWGLTSCLVLCSRRCSATTRRLMTLSLWAPPPSLPPQDFQQTTGTSQWKENFNSSCLLRCQRTLSSVPWLSNSIQPLFVFSSIVSLQWRKIEILSFVSQERVSVGHSGDSSQQPHTWWGAALPEC